MTDLTRRTLLAGTAAVAAAPLAATVHAAAPPAGERRPVFYRYKVVMSSRPSSMAYVK